MAQLALLHCNGTQGSTTFTDAVGTLTWSRSGATAIIDTAAPKFGSGDVSLTTGSVNSSTFTAQTTWTADKWFKLNSVTGTHGIIAIVGGNVNGNVTGAGNQGNGTGNAYKVSFTGQAADLTVTGTKTTWSTGTWYHLEMTYDTVAGKYYFYIDGVKDGEIISATGMSGSGAVFNLGNNGLGSNIDGFFDEFRYTSACEHPGGTTFSVPTSEYLIDTTITPAVGSLVFTGQQADVQNSAFRVITPGVGVLLLTGNLVVVRDRLFPVAAALAITGAAPASVIGKSITTGTGAIDFTQATAPEIQKGATSATSLRKYSGTGQAQNSVGAYGAPVMRKYSGLGYGKYNSNPVLRTYKGTGQASAIAYGAPAMRAYRALTTTGSPRLRKYVSAGYASVVLAEVYRTHVMNTTNNAVTEYLNHRFNSFAQIGGQYYGAGPDGFIRLDGSSDAGTNIDWKVRTGQVDDKQIGLKRLPEVVMGLRASGPIRVRVYSDDNKYYDYTLPNVKTNTIRQQRVKPGKGMVSRYFAVELQGLSNSTMELDSLQINMTPTTRRIG